jgi:NhaP-type Na+/H+ or K+/H+ antiporter
MLYYYRKVGKIMAFIVGCLMGLLVGVLGSVVVKAIKDSSF